MSAENDDVPDKETLQQGELEWSAFYDDEGRLYYYHSVSGESSWDAPERFNPPPEAPPGASMEDGAAGTTMDPSTSQGDVAADTSTAWVAYQDDEGREYYFNTITEETTWEKPEGYVVSAPETTEIEEEEEEEGVSPERTASPTAMSDQPPTPEPVEPSPIETEENSPPEAKPEEDIDPAVKQLEEARAALNQTDAIMEPGESMFLQTM